MNEENYNYNSNEFRWSGLKQQLTNLARFSDTILPEEWVWVIGLIFCGFSGVATGWLAALLFTVGKSPGPGIIWWNVAGYLFGFVLAGLMWLGIMYSQLSKIKLTGDDYSDVESGIDKASSVSFAAIASLTTIAACAMFTYSQVKISEGAIEKTVSVKAQKIGVHRRKMAYTDSLYTVNSQYWKNLDFDNDKTNDEWARVMLQKTIEERKKEKTVEDSILQVLCNLPDQPEPETIKASAADGTALLKDIGNPVKPPNWVYNVLLAILGLLIGLAVEGGLRLTGKMIGRKRAFSNVSKVLNLVNNVIAKLSDSYTSQPRCQPVNRQPSTNGSVDKNSPEYEVEEGIDIDSPKVKKILSDIENFWTENGGDLTFEQIGEMNDGVSRQYISKVFVTAKAKGKIIDPRELN